MTPTANFGGRNAFVVDGFAAEERIVDGVCVGLNVTGEAAKHLADSSTRVLGLVFEEDVLLVGKDDEEVAFGARLPLAIRKWLRSDRDSGGVGVEAEGVFARVVGTSEHDGAEACADLFDRASHGATIELDAVRRELLLLPIVRHAEAKLVHDDASEHARREQAATNEEFG